MKLKLTPLLLFLLVFQAKSQDLAFYRVDTIQSKVLWQCDKHNGFFKLKTGGFVVDKNKQVLAGRFVINISSFASLDLNSKKYATAKMIFENTIKNEFFEVEHFPIAFFDLQEIKLLSDHEYVLTGDLTLHGITNCISFKAKITIDDKLLQMTSETFTIDRTDWGIYRMSPKRPYSDDDNDWTVPDKVNLKIEVIAQKEL